MRARPRSTSSARSDPPWSLARVTTTSSKTGAAHVKDFGLIDWFIQRDVRYWYSRESTSNRPVADAGPS